MSISRSAKIEAAVIRDAAPQKQKLLDRAFAFAFRGLVYAQIWEDPVVDMEALDIRPGNRVATIASGGCNVLSYLITDPGEIVAVDLNTAHVALNRLKVAALQRLPDYAHFRRFLPMPIRQPIRAPIRRIFAIIWTIPAGAIGKGATLLAGSA